MSFLNHAARSTRSLRDQGTKLGRFTSLQSRHFHKSSLRLDSQPPAAPVKKPVGAFRGGLFGFLSGSVLAGIAVYYYVLEEYRVSNELLTEDIFALQGAVQRIEGYTRSLEEQILKKTDK